MIAELVSYDRGRSEPGRVEHVDRTHDVRSVRVRLCTNGDGEPYPRVKINAPSSMRSVALREGAETRLDCYTDQAHDARGSAVCGPEERWIRTVIDADLRRPGAAQVRARLTFEDTTTGDLFELAAVLPRGWADALFYSPADLQVPSGLVTRLDPIAATTVTDVQPERTLIERGTL